MFELEFRSARTATSADAEVSVEMVAHHLNQAAIGCATAASLSEALYSVALRYRTTPRISNEQCDRLLCDVMLAHLGAICHLPRSYSRRQVEAGMQALATQIMVWAETPDVTARRRKHFVTDLDAWARMFRNDLHNMALLEEIEWRAAQRRERKIDELRSVAGTDLRTA